MLITAAFVFLLSLFRMGNDKLAEVRREIVKNSSYLDDENHILVEYDVIFLGELPTVENISILCLFHHDPPEPFVRDYMDYSCKECGKHIDEAAVQHYREYIEQSLLRQYRTAKAAL